MILNTGNKGISLREIIEQYGNPKIQTIECRCLYKDLDGNQRDDLFGFCEYEKGKLSSLDGDTYSLDDLYIAWEIDEEKCNPLTLIKRHLTVWEYGELSED